jgi:tRNA U34 5-methylaminomethyl-2-thiouridine-forming methyltransferase MnmC
MSVKYCNAKCQKKHWSRHKKKCKQRAAELHDVALFKDPPAKEDCPICFLPMPTTLICCVSLPSVPNTDFAAANEEFDAKAILNFIIPVVERAFVKDVCTPSVSLVTDLV